MFAWKSVVSRLWDECLFLSAMWNVLCYILGLVLMSASGQAMAQELIFSLDHTENGLPLGSGRHFELERFGQDVELLFRAKEPIRTEKLYFFIDYQQEGKFQEFDTKTLAVDHNKTWAVLPYRFQQTGRYRVVVLDAEKREICRSEVEIIVKEEENSPAYFTGARVIFCNVAQKGQPDTSYQSIKVRPGEARNLAVFLKHIRPFKTHRIYVDVWVGAGAGAGQYLETFEFNLDPNWTYSQFSYEFRAAGVYTFRVYSEEEVWMATGVLEVMLE